MDLWQLKVFTSVVTHKSFSRAGEAVHISQPTVSSHIKELETHFHCTLIDRLGREAVPTKAGKLLFTYASRLLSLTGETESVMNDFLGNIKGDLVIGGSTIPSGYIIPRILGPFAAEFPEIFIHLRTGDTAEIIDTVLKGEIETGIVGAEINHPSLIQEKLINDEMKLIVPASHKWADLEQIDCPSLFKELFIAREKGSGTWKTLTETMTDAGFTPDRLRIIARLGNTASVIQGIINNAGISILSVIAVEEYIKSGRLKALSVNDLNLKRSFYITTHKKRTLSPIAETFVHFIKNFFKAQD
ncbi:MAG: selenium metabolism-associated LysR family transcriptional regulator [Desulfobacteraceae bacterium]